MNQTTAPPSVNTSGTKVVIVALIIALATVILTNIYIANVRRSVEQQSFTTYVMTRSIEMGDKLKPRDVEPIRLPLSFKSVFEEKMGAFTDRAALEARYDEPFLRGAASGELLTYRLFTGDAGGRCRDRQIAPGKRLISLPVDHKYVPVLRPGMFVDIEAMFRLPAKGVVAMPVMERVQVMSVGRYTTADERSSGGTSRISSFKSIAIEVAPEQATQLAMIKKIALGEFDLHLRNPADTDAPKIPGGGINPRIIELLDKTRLTPDGPARLIGRFDGDDDPRLLNLRRARRTMEFWLYDHSTNTRRVLQVDKDPVVVGRDDSCDIVLKGPFVARKHARVIRRGNQLFVEPLARSGTRVANREAHHGENTKVDFGDEIQIAQFSLTPIRPDRKAGDGQEDRMELQRRLMQLEQEIHVELLERMNLRVTGSINKTDDAYVAQILEHLEQILSQRIAKMDRPLILHTVYMHLHRLVIAEVVRQCQGKVQTDYHTVAEHLLDPAREKEISDLVISIVDMMPLLFDPASANEDLAIAEEAYDDLFGQVIKSTTSGLRSYIIRRTVAKDIQDIMFGLGPLQDLLEMANVSEIMVVGKDRIYVEKNGIVQPTTRTFFSDEVLLSIIERILAPVGRRVDTSTPLVDARLSDGSRVNVIINPLSLVGPCLTIRKFGWIPFTIDDLIQRGSISDTCAEFLQSCIIGRKNILIAGGTGSGKTTLLNTLSAYAHPGERILSVEESAELKLPQPHVVGLESRPANIEGRGAYTIRELVRNALRMRPDRIIVGEVRGPEALDMLQAMNTGHDGSLSTIHANTPSDACRRLETLVLMAVDMPIRAIREQVVSAIDIIVQVTRFPSGQRRVTHITEVTEIDLDTQQIRTEDIFRLKEPEQPRLRHTGYIPTFTEAMLARKQLDVRVFLTSAAVYGMNTMDMTWRITLSSMAFLASYLMVRYGWTAVTTYVRKLEAWYDRVLVQQLLMDVHPRAAVFLTGCCLVATGLFGYVVTNKFVWFIVGAAIGLMIPQVIVRHLEQKRLQRLDEQIVDGITTLSSGVRAGLNLIQAFELLVTNSHGPIRQEFQQMLREYQMGMDLNTAMRNTSNRIGSIYYRLLFSALEMHRLRGGDSGESLDRISESVREIQRLEGKLDAVTAQGRAQARMMAGMAIVIALLFYAIDPDGVERMFIDPVGRVLIVISGVLMVTGFYWIRRIMSVDI